MLNLSTVVLVVVVVVAAIITIDLSLCFVCYLNEAVIGYSLRTQYNSGGAGMLHLSELHVLCCICVVERDREVVGKLAYY